MKPKLALPPGFVEQPAAAAAGTLALPPGFIEDRRDPERERRKELAKEYAGQDVEGMGILERGLGGAKHALDRAALGLKGALPESIQRAGDWLDEKLGNKQLTGERLKQGQAFLEEGGLPAQVGNVAGDIAIQAPLAAVPGGLGVQMALGAGANALLTPGDEMERAKAGAMGAGGAAVGHVLSRALARVAKPIGDKAADTIELEARGVEPTFGQSMAQKNTALGRAVGRTEEALQSVPVASGPLTQARERAMDQWRAATREAGMPPGPAGLAQAVPDDLPGVHQAWNRRYTAALDAEPLPYASVQYQPDMRRLSQGMAVTPEQRQMAQELFEQARLTHMSNPTPGVQVTAAGAHGAESEVKTAAARYRQSQDPSQQDFGRLLSNLARDYGQAWRSGLRDPNTRNAIAELDRAYPGFKVLQKAGQRVGVVQSAGDPSRYTPTALLQASKAVDRSPGKMAYEAGQAPLQELGRLGQTLQNRLPESGTTPRALMAMATLGTGAAIEPSTLLSLAALYGYGSRPVQQYLTGRAAPEAQQAIMQWLRSAAPLAAQTGAAIARPDE